MNLSTICKGSEVTATRNCGISDQYLKKNTFFNMWKQKEIQTENKVS
jgi:hypothetical protein